MTKHMLALGLAAALALGATASQAADSDSQAFIKNAIEGNYAEINVGKLAQQKGKSDAVKQFGAMLVQDHSAANEKANVAANSIGVTPPDGSSVMEKAEYLELKVLSGDLFDRTFAKDMVSDHKADIKNYEAEALKTDAAGQYAREALLTLNKHLLAAQALVTLTQTSTTGSNAQ